RHRISQRHRGAKPLRAARGHVLRSAGEVHCPPAEGPAAAAVPRRPGEVPQHLDPRGQGDRGEEAGEEVTGEAVYLFAFDVGYDVTRARVGTAPGRTPYALDIRRDHTSPRDVALYQPLAVDPESRVTAAGRPVRLHVRVYDVGVVTVLFCVSVVSNALVDLIPFHRLTLDDGRDVGTAAREICRQAVADLGSAIVRPAPATDPEAYTVFCLTDVGGPRDVPAWFKAHLAEVAGLLSDTAPERLAEAQIVESLRHQQSFEKTDLVVVDWDAALVVDLTGYVDDVVFVLEQANLQLEEFRVMDTALDKQLTTAYTLMDQRPWLSIGRPSAVLRQLRGLSVDLAKLADEVTHITKFLGDWYLARVYLSARERFHLNEWRASVSQRLQQLENLYGVVRSEVSERRMLWLEAIIVIFFAIDIIALFLLRR